jgi:hypothetical protein
VRGAQRGRADLARPSLSRAHDLLHLARPACPPRTRRRALFFGGVPVRLQPHRAHLPLLLRHPRDAAASPGGLPRLRATPSSESPPEAPLRPSSANSDSRRAQARSRSPMGARVAGRSEAENLDRVENGATISSRRAPPSSRSPCSTNTSGEPEKFRGLAEKLRARPARHCRPGEGAAGACAWMLSVGRVPHAGARIAYAFMRHDR